MCFWKLVVDYCWLHRRVTYSSKSEVVPVHAMKAHEGVEAKLHLSVASALDGMSGQLRALAATPPGVSNH